MDYIPCDTRSVLEPRAERGIAFVNSGVNTSLFAFSTSARLASHSMGPFMSSPRTLVVIMVGSDIEMASIKFSSGIFDRLGLTLPCHVYWVVASHVSTSS